jgi:hypothetical protein
MGIRTINVNLMKQAYLFPKAQPIKRWSRYLFGGFRQKWQKLSHDRQELWRTYDGSVYAHSIPRCVWRRHGALLMLARYQKPDSHKQEMAKPVTRDIH